MEEQKKGSRSLQLIGEVDGEKVDGLIREMRELMEEDPEREITLYLASPGGSVGAGMAFHEYVRVQRVPLTVIGIGEIASIAVIVWLAGRTRKVTRRSFFLIHEVGGDYDRVTFKTKSIRDEADKMHFLERISNDIIAEVTGRTEADIQTITAERYISIREAIKFGLLKEEDVINY